LIAQRSDLLRLRDLKEKAGILAADRAERAIKGKAEATRSQAAIYRSF